MLVSALVVVITLLHYVTGHSQLYYHLFYRDLYYLPLILAGVWFGLRGALVTSLSITVLFLPFVFLTWRNVPILDFDRILEIILMNALAAVLGVISGREKQGQKALAAAQNLAAIGQAVAGIAHDIKAPLIAIAGLTRLVRKQLQPGVDSKRLDIVIRESDRLEAMLKDMLDFSRPMELNMTSEDIPSLVESTLTLIEIEAGRRNVTIKTRKAGPTAPVACDERRIREALFSLFANAVQASPEGEAVEIVIRQSAAVTMIDVVDHGTGIPEEMKERVFLPFYTTKPHGTGLGLPMALKVVKAHGGDIRILEEPSGGTIFRITLPRGRSK